MDHSKDSVEILLKSKEDTKHLAKVIAYKVRAQDVITLKGDLGVGKTAFSKYFINAIVGHEIEVTSPTFTLVNQYDAPNFTVCHYDLYRLEHIAEAHELGIEEAFSKGVSIIEWPDIINNLLPEDRLEICLEYGQQEEERIVKIKGCGRWKNQLNAVLTHK
jgi:tRNA threonylcarbamoyl adenosine modification protein YjeE